MKLAGTYYTHKGVQIIKPDDSKASKYLIAWSFDIKRNKGWYTATNSLKIAKEIINDFRKSEKGD